MNPRTAAVALVLAFLSFPVPAQITNPDFEEPHEASPPMPRGWRLVGDGGAVSLDAAYSHGGRQSLRLEKKEGAEFTGVGQAIDALPWRGKVVHLTAWFRAEGLRGGSGTLWSRTDGAGRRALDFASARFDPSTGSADWTARHVFLSIDASADQLHFGATLSGRGTLWFDSVTITELDVSKMDNPPSKAARDYIDEAIAKIRENAYRAGEVDWDRARGLAVAIASGATTAADAHPAVTWLMKTLKDRHSFMAPPSVADKLAENARTDDFGIRSAIVSGKAYLDVPGFSGTHPARTNAFVAELKGRIRAMAEGKPCGWILDLRHNTGGNMYPMLDGLVPLFGDGTLGYFIGHDSKYPWFVKGGLTLPGGYPSSHNDERSTFLVEEGKAAVAVLTGPRTASSGEAVAVSFRGRPNSRTFGKPTAGQSSGNRGVRMSDGAMLLIMTALFADRTGSTYGDTLHPDEFVSGDAKDSPLDADPVVNAASRWLNSLPRCKL